MLTPSIVPVADMQSGDSSPGGDRGATVRESGDRGSAPILPPDALGCRSGADAPSDRMTTPPDTPRLARLRFGTSSWSEKSWVGPFYPPGTRPADYLRHYATQFDTVEADVTWYRIPDARLVDGWAAKLPEGFRLAAKFPRTIVHGGEGPRPDPERVLNLEVEAVRKDLDDFTTAMARLGARCGPLVLQLPFFNSSVFRGPGPFFDRLDTFLSRLPQGFRIAVEVRNKAWLGPALCDLLRRHQAALVLVDIAYMPHPAWLAERFDVVTSDFTYCRLIGDRKAIDAMTDSFDRVVVDHSARLDRWSRLIRALQPRVRDLFVYANNHYAGHGPATIRDLVARVVGADAPRASGLGGSEQDG